MADVTIFGKKISPAMAVVFAGGSAIAIWFAYKQHKASSSTAATSLDPVTGLPYSQDNVTDPLTGMPYLAEAQQYGSVSAAEAAVAGESSLAYSAGGYGTSGLVGTSTGASLVPANTVQGTAYATNAAWAQAVEAGLTDIGYAPTDIAAALGRYLGGLSETPAQATIVQAAVAEYGPPPVGSFQIIQAPAATATTSGTTSTGTTSTTSTTTAGPTPAGVPWVAAQWVNRTSTNVHWPAVTGANQYQVRVTYQSQLVQTHTTSGENYTITGLTPNHTYGIHVVAIHNGQQWPPEASTSVHTPK